MSKAETIAHEGRQLGNRLRILKNTIRKEIIYRLTLLGNSPEDTLLGLRHAALNTRILRSPRIADLMESAAANPLYALPRVRLSKKMSTC